VRTLVATHPGHADAPERVRQFVKYGASPRGLQAMVLGAKVRALLDDRYHVAEDDLRGVAKQALRHRLLLNFEGEAEGIDPDSIVDDVIAAVSPAVVA
jgi:MoxR-like ATPase